MIVTFRDAKILTDETGVWLCLRPEEAAPCRGFVLGKKDARYDAEIKAHRDKRSLDANSYCWVLLEKLAQETGIEKEEIYRQTIKKFGPHKDFTLAEDEAKTFRVAWEKLGTGWPTEQVDFTPDGQRVVIRAYYGSSTYNTKQMSRLIDNIVQDCRAVGIETLPPDKLAGMMEEWGNAKADKGAGDSA